MFPFGKTKKALKDEIKRRKIHLIPDLADIIWAVKPYQRGNKMIFALHDLNRHAKHRMLTAVAMPAAKMQFQFSSILVYEIANQAAWIERMAFSR